MRVRLWGPSLEGDLVGEGAFESEGGRALSCDMSMGNARVGRYDCRRRAKMWGKRRILLTLYLAHIPGPGGCCNNIACHIPGMPAEARMICWNCQLCAVLCRTIHDWKCVDIRADRTRKQPSYHVNTKHAKFKGSPPQSRCALTRIGCQGSTQSSPSCFFLCQIELCTNCPG